SMALVAIDVETDEMLGAVRLFADSDYRRGEYGIMVRSDLKGADLGWRLMQQMIEVARWMGLETIEGQVLRENSTMLAMCRKLGCMLVPVTDSATLMLVTQPVEAAPPIYAGFSWSGHSRSHRPPGPLPRVLWRRPQALWPLLQPIRQRCGIMHTCARSCTSA